MLTGVVSLTILFGFQSIRGNDVDAVYHFS